MTVAESVTADPAARAEEWLTRSRAARPMPAEVADIGDDSAGETMAALACLAVARGLSLLILVPDDEPLPAVSTALDLRLRPLCLVLPAADFAARIAMRATLSLLRSRLARDDDDAQDAAWQEQRRRIAAQPALWEAASTWTNADDRLPWPRDVAKLFPVRILPIGAYRNLPRQEVDLVAFFRCDLGLETPTLAGMHLHIGAAFAARTSGSVALADDALRLRQEHEQLTRDVAELELELATAQCELGAFTERYVELVAGRMTELDALRAELALQRSASADDPLERSKAERLRAEAARSAGESRRFRQARAEAPASEPFRPSQDVKRLFRQLAQKIHPDRAADEEDRAWRTQLMSEANQAYRAADIHALQSLAARWEQGAPARQDVAPDSRTAPSCRPENYLMDQVARLRERLAAIQRELNRLFGSKLYELFLAARQAMRHGRDLLQEMAESLDSQICRARSDLGAAP